MADSLLSVVSVRMQPLSDTPDLDSSVLLAAIAQRPRAWILAHPDIALTASQRADLDLALRRLERGEAFPYVLGEWEFFGLPFLVTRDVLIPRPETEGLVERAIEWLQATPSATSALDIGTGSGCIAVAIAVHVPSVSIVATDISKEALNVARRNAQRHGVERRIAFVECDLLPTTGRAPGTTGTTLSDGRPPRFDLLCANLPYIPSEELTRLPVYKREPNLALDGGADGLQPLRRLCSLAPTWISPRAKLLLEIESTHASQARSIAGEAFPRSEIEVLKDLTGRDRLLDIQLKG